jgi:Domain of unknown function (DUF4864)
VQLFTPIRRIIDSDAPEADIRAVIGDQFADFRAGDVSGAFEEASPFIRQMFGTAENFGRMVQEGYPAIWGAQSVEFLGLREAEGRMVQRLRVRDAAGAEATYDYEMIEVDGLWRINGVHPVEDDSIGV